MDHVIYKYGPAARTPAQRAGILQQMLAYYVQQRIKLPLHAHALHQRYVAGELSWLEVCALPAPVSPFLQPANPAAAHASRPYDGAQ